MEMLIGGRWVGRKKTIPVIDPFRGRIVDQVPRSGPDDVEEAMSSAVRGAHQMAVMTARQRFDILRRAADRIEAQAAELAETLVQEVGKTIREARGEVARAVQTFAWAAEEAKRIHGESVPLDAAPGGGDRLGFTIRVPLGVVAAITPFNFPLNLAAHKVAPALAAGNSVVLKPATEAPLADLKLAHILLESGLPPEAINVLTGPGGEVGDRIVSDERPRMVTFTGSAEVGLRIMARIGLKKVTMELGSNSSVIVLADADVQTAAERIVAGAFALAGQVCISVQRVYAHRTIFRQLVQEVAQRAERLQVGDPGDEHTDVGPMISAAAAERAGQWIQEALQAGGARACGGRREGSLVWPTVLTEVPHRCRICSQEAFAPVVVINAVEDLEEAIARANDSPYGLQGGIFTRDLDSALQAAKRIEVGGLMVNEVPTFRLDHMPYGGMKMSGIGREGVRYAVEEMTEIKLICFRW